ncbi:MAG TPA: hypothetical protein VNJ28_02395, partial [Candidatus Limnocylindrales bacterium]|nr:hypothetical protein [Candidatus Limnocylindrales bacterium]
MKRSPTLPIRLTGRLWLALVVALGATVATPPRPALAAEEIVQTASTTYEALPERNVLRVTIDLRVTNQVPNETTLVPCTRWYVDPWLGLYPIVEQCPQTTRFYVTDTQILVEATARNLRATADRGTVRIARTSTIESFATYRLTFARIFRGETRRIRVTYDVPGAAPRSGSSTRLGRAYVRFCAFGNGEDGGSLRVVIPRGYEIVVRPSPMARTTSGGRVVYSSGAIAAGETYARCFEGTNPAAYERIEIVAGYGTRLVALGWPEDPGWGERVAGQARMLVDALVRLFGPPPGRPERIELREVAGFELGDYAGAFDPDEGVALISEAAAEGRVVAHELAHAWFNSERFAARWMSEGLAEWAARKALEEVACQAGPYPGPGSPDLDDWPILDADSTDAQRRLVAYLYDAACSIPFAIEERIGGSGRSRSSGRCSTSARPTRPTRSPGGGTSNGSTGATSSISSTSAASSRRESGTSGSPSASSSTSGSPSPRSWPVGPTP